MKQIISIAIATACFVLLSNRAEAQFVQNTNRSLFSDVKAFQIGDAVTILISEDTQADNSASTANSRSTDLSGGVTAGAGAKNTKLDLGISTGNTFKAQGQTGRNEKIRSRLSARVTEVEPNGNLRIEGTRTTKINGETQTIVISGVVRPVDITPSNSIYSYNILDLNLTIEGDGTVTEVQEPGLITKFLRMLF